MQIKQKNYPVMTRYNFESLSFHRPDKAMQWSEVDRKLTGTRYNIITCESTKISEKDTTAHLVHVLGTLE